MLDIDATARTDDVLGGAETLGFGGDVAECSVFGAARGQLGKLVAAYEYKYGDSDHPWQGTIGQIGRRAVEH